MTPTEFISDYEVAGRTRGVDALLALIADDAVFLFSNQTSHVGKDAIRKAIQANFDTIEAETYRMSELRWLAATDALAICVYEFDWSGRIAGKPASGSGRGTTAIRRDDGAWRVVHEHLSRGRLTSE
jgi:uncharacterized protein (TIGR02246 family)